MELLLHGSRSKGDVFWCSRSEEDPKRFEKNSGEGEAPKLQQPRSHWDCCQEFSGYALCHRFRTLTPHPGELLFGWRRGTAGGPARCRADQRLSGNQRAYLTRSALESALRK